MSKYSGSISIIDDAGNVVFERELTSDECIEALIERREVLEPTKRTFSGPAKLLSTTYKGSVKFGRQKKADSDAGGGRIEEIAALFNEGLKAAAVAKKLKVDIRLVYAYKSKAKKAGLLNVQPKNTEEKSEPEIDVATERSVKDLASMGWTVKAIAEETGLTTKQVLQITKARKGDDL